MHFASNDHDKAHIHSYLHRKDVLLQKQWPYHCVLLRVGEAGRRSTCDSVDNAWTTGTPETSLRSAPLRIQLPKKLLNTTTERTLSLRATIYLGPDWGPARTLQIWANRIAWFDKLGFKGPVQTLTHPIQCGVLGGTILASNHHVLVKESGQIFPWSKSRLGHLWSFI